MTKQERAENKYLGKHVTVDISMGSIRMSAVVDKVKLIFGRVDLLVTPLANCGSGYGWITDKAVKVWPIQPNT